MTTRGDGTAREAATLFVALELSDKTWLIGSAAGPGRRARRITVPGGDWKAVLREMERARAHFGLERDSRVVCCYESSRYGFWLARCLEAHGVACRVVDAGSVRRRPGKRHRKTDRLDVETLLSDLMMYESGDRERSFRTVRVPSQASEDLRQLQRERRVLIRERTAHWNRVRGLLMARGVQLKSRSRLRRGCFEDLRTWDGAPLGAELLSQLHREIGRLALVGEQLRELHGRRRELLKKPPEQHGRTLECVSRLAQLRGVGEESAWTLGAELFGWREFHNRRQVGGYLGLAGTPHQSGTMDRDLGIGKDGPGWVRALSIELAWSWLRFQPDSALSRWFQDRYVEGKRNRRRGIVALARKLVVALWHYLDHGVLPEGATLKTEAA